MLVLLHHVVIAVVHHRQLEGVAAETVTEGVQVERDQQSCYERGPAYGGGGADLLKRCGKKNNCLFCFLITGSLVDVLNVKLEP